jgi:hypothetical protein
MELVVEAERHMEPKQQSNTLVKLSGCERTNVGVEVLKAEAIVRATPCV